jgi:hypothetical protein
MSTLSFLDTGHGELVAIFLDSLSPSKYDKLKMRVDGILFHKSTRTLRRSMQIDQQHFLSP